MVFYFVAFSKDHKIKDHKIHYLGEQKDHPMSTIKEIRILTGLSHEKLAAWLGVSKSMVQFAEKGDRMLNGNASKKLTQLAVPVQQLKKTIKISQGKGAAVHSSSLDLATRHQKKMDHHLLAAEKLQQEVNRLELQRIKLTTRLALLDIMKNLDSESYKSTKPDKQIVELLEFFGSGRMAAGIKKQELLQDKINTHLSYAAIHKVAWKRFRTMRR